MKSRKLTLITAITLFAALAMPVRLAAQGRPAGQTENPVPLINQPLVPDAVAPGGKKFQLTVNGTGFVSGSVVNWNGSARATTFVNSSQLTATIPASDITKASSASVTVVNPGPGGGTSNVAFFPILLPNSFASFSRSDFGPTGEWGIASADFNGDGKLDLAAVNISSNALSIMLGRGNGAFHSPANYDTGSAPVVVVTGDFNADGKLDLAVANSGAGISIFLGKGDGTFQNHVDYPAGNGPAGIVTGDFNGDGKLDLAVTDWYDNTVSVLLGNGDGTFQPPVPYGTGTTPNQVKTGDFNGDGKLDLAVTNFGSNTVSVLIGNGDGSFQGHVEYPAGSGGAGEITADFNGDGKLDLAVSNYNDNTLSVLLGNGDGSFQAPVDYLVNNSPEDITAVDFNGDGKLDLAVAALSSNAVSLLLGNGDGTFQGQTQYATAAGPARIAAGDFNRDGKLDLAVATENGAVSILLQDETIRLSPPGVNFDIQLVGTRSAPQKVELTNTGSHKLTIRGIAITGRDAHDFSQNHTCGSSLPPKAHCTISVTFKPTRLGARTAAVTITDDAPGSPQSVPLSGIGVTSGPNATLSTKHLTFPIQLVGTASPAHPVTLSNYGTMTLDINSIVASGDFGETHTCGSTLEPGAHCTISVTFTPTRGGHRTGTLSITDNAPDSPQKVSLKGMGTVVKLDPSSLDFGTVKIGQKSSPQNSTLTNVGSTKLHIISITITGTDAGDFSQQNNCPDPGYLGAGKSCTITVTFQPTQSGSRSADVSVSDDGGGSPQQVSLSGTGQSQCGGRCNQGRCPTGCRCFRGYVCIAASSAVVEETASRQTCSQTTPFTELR